MAFRSLFFDKAVLSGCGKLSHPEIGDVHYTVRTNARRVIARWKGSGLHVTLPPSMSLSDVEAVLDRMKPKLIKMRPQERLYEAGHTFDFGDFRVQVCSGGEFRRGCAIISRAARDFEIRLGSDEDFYSQAASMAISEAMKKIARYLAPVILLPRAGELASALGCSPRRWSVSSGRRVLGRCNTRGEIAISSVVVFLPQDLRDYIVCHELAHLSEMNHSAAFHAVCNRYCGGREAEFVRRLRSFKFPLV